MTLAEDRKVKPRKRGVHGTTTKPIVDRQFEIEFLDYPSRSAELASG